MIQATVVGSYPRVGDSLEKQELRKAIALFEEGKINAEDLAQVEDKVTQEVIKEQEKAGLDVITDGQIRWVDPVSQIMRAFDGVKISGLLRWFDNNFYFRQPIITGQIRWKSPIFSKDFEFASKQSKKPVKVVLTGPYTLARLSKNEFYKDFQSLYADITKAIAQEIHALVNSGAKIIQIDEPAILLYPQDFKLFEKEFSVIAGALKGVQSILFTYFGDHAKALPFLLNLPVNTLGLDLVSKEGNFESFLKNVKTNGKHFILGLLDGRNTRLEKAEDVLPKIKSITEKIPVDRLSLSPSSGLEFLPRDVAFQKMISLVNIAKKAEKQSFRIREAQS
jgi:5-methyltetrahydropteroyltriglutamate--homocysteine methyltransferase